MVNLVVNPCKEAARLRKAHALYLTLVREGVEVKLVEQVADLMRQLEQVAS